MAHVADEKFCGNQDLFPLEVIDHMFSLKGFRIFLVDDHNSDVSEESVSFSFFTHPGLAFGESLPSGEVYLHIWECLSVLTCFVNGLILLSNSYL